MSAPTHLYRHFDADGRLLYVGISLFAVNRLSQVRIGASPRLRAYANLRSAGRAPTSLRPAAEAVFGDWRCRPDYGGRLNGRDSSC
jgi:hypothetical protein